MSYLELVEVKKPAEEGPRGQREALLIERLEHDRLVRVVSRIFDASYSTGVAEPPELSRLKCAGHHHKGNTSSYAFQMEQLLVCRVTS